MATAPLGDGFVPMVVGAIERDTDDSVVITFDPGGGAMPFTHGQHLTLRRVFDGVEVRRSYSICSAAPDGPLRVAVRRVDGGVFSTWATTELEPGATLDVLPPSGHFTHPLEPTATRRYTALAAGSGITPVFSIIATILRDEPRSRVSLLYVNRTSRSAMLLDELHDLRDRSLTRFDMALAFTRETGDAPLLHGRPDRAHLDALVAAGFLPADTDEAFLCGPAALVDEAVSALVDAGLAPERIHRELFTGTQVGRAAPQPVAAGATPVATGEARLHGRTSPFEVYDGDSVLDAVQRVRPDAPYACRSGVCSTCQAVLRAGAVEMAVHHGLTDDELARGYVLTCQSRATTPHVVVDYDAS